MFPDRIVIHIGLPKCASSALQTWFHDNKEHLAAAGIDYPDPTPDSISPKHQELVSDLLGGHCKSLGRYIEGCTQPTLLLSTEGLSNHLFDYDEAALADFRHHASGCPIELIIVNRDAEAWVKSRWAQALVSSTMPQYLYGTAMHLDEFARHPRNLILLDRERTSARAKEAYGARVVLTTEPATMLTDIAAFLKVQTDAYAAAKRYHLSPSADVLALIRQINAIGVADADRIVAMGALEYLRPSQHNQLKPMRDHFLSGDAFRVLDLILSQLDPENSAQAQIIEDLRRLLVSGALTPPS